VKAICRLERRFTSSISRRTTRRRPQALVAASRVTLLQDPEQCLERREKAANHRFGAANHRFGKAGIVPAKDPEGHRGPPDHRGRLSASRRHLRAAAGRLGEVCAGKTHQRAAPRPRLADVCRSILLRTPAPQNRSNGCVRNFSEPNRSTEYCPTVTAGFLFEWVIIIV
jgi:hypothetical protein